ncbi:MAG: uracil-DNA glycosylase [Firmicutes bacterium]|nr:uracil-DNA glycosylase [Bacillota bacterium]
MKIGNSWDAFFETESKKEYFIRLVNTVKSEYDNFTIYPPRGSAFNAFKFTPLDDVRVVILGQDPYHGRGQAMGLSFSVPNGTALPPSLKNIYKELEGDLGIKRHSGCLIDIAKQGVFFLNASLTVQEGMPNSHSQLGWQTFTDNVIKEINEKQEQVIFILWGSYAKKKTELITNPIHKILSSGHPSPLSVNLFLGCKHFSKTNAYLTAAGFEPICWEEKNPNS